MTTLNHLSDVDESARAADATTVSVFGVAWPRNKAIALAGAIVTIAVILLAGGSGVMAMWVSATVLLGLWWGGRAVATSRWDYGERDHHRYH